jgi:hypothetical protein
MRGKHEVCEKSFSSHHLSTSPEELPRVRKKKRQVQESGANRRKALNNKEIEIGNT